METVAILVGTGAFIVTVVVMARLDAQGYEAAALTHGVESQPSSVKTVHVVGDIYRFTDPDNGVTCYESMTSISCLPPWKD